MKMKEYKVLSQKDKFLSGTFDSKLLEKAIDASAEQGWIVVSMASGRCCTTLSS
jgi:hypothetical protein